MILLSISIELSLIVVNEAVIDADAVTSCEILRLCEMLGVPTETLVDCSQMNAGSSERTTLKVSSVYPGGTVPL